MYTLHFFAQYGHIPAIVVIIGLLFSIVYFELRNEREKLSWYWKVRKQTCRNPVVFDRAVDPPQTVYTPGCARGDKMLIHIHYPMKKHGRPNAYDQQRSIWFQKTSVPEEILKCQSKKKQIILA